MSDKEIIALYQDISNPSSFGTMPQFRNYLKAEKNVEITINKLKAILRAGVPSTTLFHHINETFPRRVLFTPTLDSSWSAGRVIMLILSDIALQRVSDLAFFPLPVMRSNRCGAFLIVVENLSLFCWLRKVKSAKAVDVGDVFEQLLYKSGRVPGLLITDQGNEFVGKSFQSVLSKFGIQHNKSSQQPNKGFLN